MKMLLITLLFISFSLEAREKITGEEVKNLIMENIGHLNNYVEGSVYQMRQTEKKTGENGLECQYESFMDFTVLLVSKDPLSSYLYAEVYNRLEEGTPNYDECAKIVLTPKMEFVALFDKEISPTIEELNEISHSNDEYFKTDDGLIISSDGKEECFMDLKTPYLFMETKCISDGVITSQTQKLPDADLKVLYKKLKNSKIIGSYPSGPDASTSYELPMTFGEVLKEWKENKSL
jgi:hypothetical protein